MGGLDDVLGTDPGPPPTQLLEAVVHRVDTAGLHVRLRGGDQRYVHGPCAWSGAGAPPPGTRCLVARSDRRRWWVLAFDGWAEE